MMHGRKSNGPRLMGKLRQVNWILVLLIGILASIGFAMLYSAANGNFSPWASRQMAIFAFGLVVMLAIGLVDIRVWLRYAYWPYGLILALLVCVEIFGEIKGGAQRWLDLRVFQLQPSEFMKFALVLALARYFHRLNFDDIGRPQFLLAPLFLIVVPVALVQRQPDLGTALFMLLGGAAIFFIAGVRLWKFAVVAVAIMVAVPVVWPMLKAYQQERVLTFLSPERDPGNKGYQILQSKIALGSGGTFGRGYMKGTQSHLNFLPERQTDFIFTMLAEEFGLVGGLGLLGLYALLLAYGTAIALRSTSQFGRLLAMGVTMMVFLYVFINIAMVMGLLPVVGLPLPLISRGGTAMLAVLVGFGLIISVYVHRDARIGRHGENG